MGNSKRLRGKNLSRRFFPRPLPSSLSLEARQTKAGGAGREKGNSRQPVVYRGGGMRYDSLWPRKWRKLPDQPGREGEKTKIPLCSFFPYSSGPTCQIIKLGTFLSYFQYRHAGRQKKGTTATISPPPSCRALLCLCGLAVCKIQWIRLRGT